jgi:hypothetical protein
MTGLREYLFAGACIFAINLLPAFAPPTWALLVFFKLDADLATVPLVLGGAAAAATGRLALACSSRGLRRHFSARRLESLAAAQRALTGDRRRSAGGLALFALSPLPSSQLFVAAGLLAVPLVPLTCAFFAGRLVSYTLYLTGASLAARGLKHTMVQAFGSPWGIAAQVLMLMALVALVGIDWAGLLERRAERGGRGGVRLRRAMRTRR